MLFFDLTKVNNTSKTSAASLYGTYEDKSKPMDKATMKNWASVESYDQNPVQFVCHIRISPDDIGETGGQVYGW